MREALARADNDFILPERSRVRRPKAADRPAGRLGSGRLGSGRLAAGFASHVLARPGRAVAVIIGFGLMVAILVNALAMQRGRHPSPLFGSNLADRTDKPARVEAAPPPAAVNPPARPVELASPPSEAARSPAPPSARTASRDPIGDIIRSGDAKADPKADPLRLVGSAQRALVKLGYGPLKTDGTLGIGTRLAIERFEKDKNLPVTGELSVRVSRALSAAAGMPVE